MCLRTVFLEKRNKIYAYSYRLIIFYTNIGMLIHFLNRKKQLILKCTHTQTDQKCIINYSLKFIKNYKFHNNDSVSSFHKCQATMKCVEILLS